MTEERAVLKIHVVPWEQSKDWEPAKNIDLYALCGLHVQHPMARKHSWVNPNGWASELAPYFYRCPDCSAHPDYAMILLGAL